MPRIKPTIDTDCTAATGDSEAVRTAALSWPACGPAHAGAVLQLSSTVLPTGQHVALLDVWRAHPARPDQLLVRCAPEHLQAAGQPLGTTLQAHTQHHASRLLALEQVAAEAEALLDAWNNASTLLDLWGAMARLQNKVQDALEVENG